MQNTKRTLLAVLLISVFVIAFVGLGVLLREKRDEDSSDFSQTEATEEPAGDGIDELLNAVDKDLDLAYQDGDIPDMDLEADFGIRN